MYLTISQAAEYLKVHPDTLRRWEKKGLISPARKGKRGDRGYLISDLKTVVSGERKQPNYSSFIKSKSEEYMPEVVSFLKELVKTKSVNGEQEEHDIADLTYSHALKLGLPAKLLWKEKERPNVFVGNGFEDKKSFLFVAHMDTVPVGAADKWTYDPFSAIVKGGKMYGRGTADCKAGIALSIYALKILDNLGLNNIAKFVGGVDEEMGAQSDFGIIYLLQKGLKASAGIYTYPGFDTISLGSRGLIRLVISCEGEQVHTGLSGWTRGDKGKSAIEGMLLLIDEIKKIRLISKHDDFPELASKITITKFNAGVGESIVPPYAEMLVDVRLLPGVSNLKFIVKVKKLARDLANRYGYKYSVKVKNNGPSWVISRNENVVKILRKKTREIFKVEPRLVGRGPFNEGGIISEFGIPIVGGYGVTGVNVHGIDEHIVIGDIPKVLQVYCETAIEMYQRARK